MSTKRVLITGGSSGIGLAISRQFAAQGYNIIWVSLLGSEMKNAQVDLQTEFPACEIDSLALDLTTVGAPERVVAWVEENGWSIDILINNAGVGRYGFVNEIKLEDEAQMILLNVVAVHRLTRLFLSQMVERDYGTIILLSSTTSLQPVPKFVTYASTKAFVTHFGRGLTEELRVMKSKVKVLTLCPAAVSDTRFKAAANMDHVKTFSGLTVTRSTEVARDLWQGFIRGKSFVISGWKHRLFAMIQYFLPYSVVQFLVRQELSEKDSPT